MRRPLPMTSDPMSAFAWLQRIDNGILVHYNVSVKFRRRMRMPRASGFMGIPNPHFVEGDEDEGAVAETYFVTQRTVFCSTFDDVCKVMEDATKANEQIEQLEKEGKLLGGTFVAEA